MMLSLQAFLGEVWWYARARQGFCLFCAAAVFSISVILALPHEAGAHAARMSIAGAPVLAFAISFLMPLPRSFSAASSWGAGLALTLGAFLVWVALPENAAFFSLRLAQGAGAAAVAGALAGWTNHRLALAARPAELSFFTACSDAPSLAIAILAAAQECWPGWDARLLDSLDVSKKIIIFGRQPGLSIEIEETLFDQSADAGPDVEPVLADNASAPNCLVSMIWRPGASRAEPAHSPLSTSAAFQAAISKSLPESRPTSVL